MIQRDKLIVIFCITMLILCIILFDKTATQSNRKYHKLECYTCGKVTYSEPLQKNIYCCKDKDGKIIKLGETK